MVKQGESKQFNYLYPFENFQDRYDCYNINEAVQQSDFLRNIINDDDDKKRISMLIASYATGLHFIQHKEVKYPEILSETSTSLIIGDRYCELSLLKGDIPLYPRSEVTSNCTNTIFYPDENALAFVSEAVGMKELISFLEAHHALCCWYIHTCDLCKVSIWANEYSYSNYSTHWAPKILIETVCCHCIRNEMQLPYVPIIKLCSSCRFTCGACKLLMCNSHIVETCCCCQSHFCDCIKSPYYETCPFFEKCRHCNSIVCRNCVNHDVCGKYGICKDCLDDFIII